jgi:hypothetical protein
VVATLAALAIVLNSLPRLGSDPGPRAERPEPSPFGALAQQSRGLAPASQPQFASPSVRRPARPRPGSKSRLHRRPGGRREREPIDQQAPTLPPPDAPAPAPLPAQAPQSAGPPAASPSPPPASGGGSGPRPEFSFERQ